MSSFYCFDIYKKHGDTWTLESADQDASFFKNMATYRGIIDAEPVSLENEDLCAIQSLQDTIEREKTNGRYYDSDSFYKYSERKKKEYEESMKKAYNIEKQMESLEYLKLFPEEKDNVLEEYNSYIQEANNLYYAAAAALTAGDILECGNYAEKSIMYVYGG